LSNRLLQLSRDVLGRAFYLISIHVQPP
jgi:hypothetical protein